VKLLRALQEGELRRVGSNRTQKVDARVIAASNRDVQKEVESGRFRQDLFYRLNAVTIHLPPLRERKEDIIPLAESLVARASHNGHRVTFSPEANRLLEQYSWPGNIRELENTVIRAAALCDNLVRPEDLPEQVRNCGAASDIRAAELASTDTAPVAGEEWPTLSEVEGRYVARVLAHTMWNKQAASRLLGVDYKTLGRMIQRHHIRQDKP
jgi:two-component system response regulator AtoC